MSETPSYPNERDCEHGNMRRKCDMCECQRELAAVTRERETAVEDAYARGLDEGRIDLTKIVRKWDGECLDPPEVEGLRDYAMLDGERLETLWRAFELAMAREMETARERDEALKTMNSHIEHLCGVARRKELAHEIERDALRADRDAWIAANGPGGWIDALRAEVERLTSAIRWALGYDEGPPDFEPPEDADKRRYWWREELMRRAALTPAEETKT